MTTPFQVDKDSVNNGAYIRYLSHDTVLDDLTSKTNFHVEPWDYNTTRIVWGADTDIHAVAVQDVAASLVPRMVITRSSFGHPVTPLDGQKIFDKEYMEVVYSDINLTPPTTFETQAASDDNPYNRAPTNTQSLYDRNLVSGRWYYYSLFFFLKGGNATQKWVKAGTMEALLPINYDHAGKLYELVPPYYRSKDQEYIAGIRNEGVLSSLLKVIGFEADYTRTLAEGIDNVYNVDYTPNHLLFALGETNMGVQRESGLGDARYRSILARINKLYDERGSSSGVQKLVLAASKYNCKIIEGVNRMNLTDDAEFLTNTGSWGKLHGTEPYNTFAASNDWLSAGNYWVDSSTTTFNPVSLTVVQDTESPSLRNGSMEVKNVSGASGNGLLITCGLGAGSVLDRLHTAQSTTFSPQMHGIRCAVGTVEEFSFYSKVTSGSSGNISMGIMWFNLRADSTFDVTTDFISEATTKSVTTEMSAITRYTLESKAPISPTGAAYVYAVPFIGFSNSSTRHVYSCMFNDNLNSAATSAVSLDNTLTLGTSETLNQPGLYIGTNS